MFNPILAAKNIREEYISYIDTTFCFSDENLRLQFKEQLRNMVSKGPYLEINDVFETGKSINELINENILSPLFKKIELVDDDGKCVLPLDRKLYKHQEEAIRKIVSGENVVITTGTGSGKTNCFLIPVINELLREKESGELGEGIRALFIYPMNALANDQIKNIRRLLMNYKDITFGVYNGGTEEEEEDAIKLYEAMFFNETIEKLKHRLPNELISREEMKNNPPNILFTNYAMLEHLLFRPQDSVLFSGSKFKFIVLDEAHVYSGATGIETAVLLKRLRARIEEEDKPTQFILTSATLGNDESCDNDIIKFATNLTDVSFKKDNIIRSKRVKRKFEGTSISYNFNLIHELADENNVLLEVLKKYNLTIEGKDDREKIFNLISSSIQYKLLREHYYKINSNIESIDNLIKAINANDITNVIDFISLCSQAQKNGSNLIDVRFHYFIRSLEGAFLTLEKEPKLFLTRQKFNNDYKVFEIAICDNCGKYALVGKIENDILTQSNKFYDEIDYFYPAQQSNEDIEDDNEEPKNLKQETYLLCPHCGKIVKKVYARDGKICDCNDTTLVELVKAKSIKNSYQIQSAKCGNCNIGTYARFYLGNDVATSVIATSLYEELPSYEYKEQKKTKKIEKNSIFAKYLPDNAEKNIISKIRQFLVFSDSRQEAAKFASYLSKSYKEFLRRRGIYQILVRENETFFDILSFAAKLNNYFYFKNSFVKSYDDYSSLKIESEKNANIALLNELARFESPTSLTSLGLLQFKYLGSDKNILHAIEEEYKVSEKDAKTLIDLLAFEFVKFGAISFKDENKVDAESRKYIFYSEMRKYISLNISKEKTNNIGGWLPKRKSTSKVNEYYQTRRLYYVRKVLNISEKDAYNFLEDFFEFLSTTNELKYGILSPLNDGNYYMPIENFAILTNKDPEAHWYKCKKCGKISQFNIKGHCINIRCDGDVEEIPGDSISKDNHYANLYFSDKLSPLLIKEHTAQLSRRESLEYQEEFVKKKINALSCSTTFEMGVDVGDLETVLLRNVPPLPSNYSQRAGRAGRSLNAAAFCLTFAKLSSHDLSFFNEPEKMIKGTILPPLFNIGNEKIVRRHIYDVALGLFFRKNPNLYNFNDADLFINKKGYNKFLDWLNSKPNELKLLLKKSIPFVSQEFYDKLDIENFGRLNDFIGKNGTFTILIKEYENNVKEFEDLIYKYKEANDYKTVYDLSNKLKIYKNNKLIDFLARGNVLPRYGFPVDTVELEVNKNVNDLDKLRLTRDLSVAIAEYAPSSEVVANDRLYTSRYIKKSLLEGDRKEWHTAYIGECNNEKCHAINFSATPISENGYRCSSCGEIIPIENFVESIDPLNGFVTEKNSKDVPLTKQEKNYKSQDLYIGDTNSKLIESHSITLNGIRIDVESTANDSLLVKSYTDFYVCKKCGYALAIDEIQNHDIVDGDIRLKPHSIKMKNAHESLQVDKKCDSKELFRYYLHHVFKTDVAKINFDCDTSDYKTMISTMYAILYAITSYLNIERKDLKACLSLKYIEGKKKYSIIIYDSVPGGAGHSRRLVANGGELLKEIFKVAYNNMISCKCDPSCYNCLRSYDNQRIHDDLDRKLAVEFLKKFIV